MPFAVLLDIIVVWLFTFLSVKNILKMIRQK